MAATGLAEHPALAPCCQRVGEEFAAVADLGAVSPRLRAKEGTAPGFQLTAWSGETVLCSWRRVWEHILDENRHRNLEWAPVLHTVRQPCLVVTQEPGARRERIALYRLDPDVNPFCNVILERLDRERLVIVTALMRPWFAGEHQRRLPAHIVPSCTGYCVRRGDQNPYSERCARWSDATASFPADCCEAGNGPCPPDRRIPGSIRIR